MSSLPKSALLLRCCYLHYLEDMNIQEIAEYLNISRFRVGRYLKEGRENGIVQIQIQDPAIEYEQLALQMERTFPFRRVIVVPTPYNADPDTIRRALGKAAVDLFLDVGPETSIGIIWGRTIAYMVENLPSGSLRAKRVVEIAGGLGHITSKISAHTVALQTAEKLNAECLQLQAPIIADTAETAQAFLSESSIRRTLELATQCNIAVVGVGPMDLHSLLHQSGFLATQDFEQLKAAGAVGAILGRFYDANGKECDTSYRHCAISPTFDQFRQIPERIALAGGKNKVQSILGLARGELITTLVTDSETATALLTANRDG